MKSGIAPNGSLSLMQASKKGQGSCDPCPVHDPSGPRCAEDFSERPCERGRADLAPRHRPSLAAQTARAENFPVAAKREDPAFAAVGQPSDLSEIAFQAALAIDIGSAAPGFDAVQAFVRKGLPPVLFASYELIAEDRRYPSAGPDEPARRVSCPAFLFEVTAAPNDPQNSQSGQRARHVAVIGMCGRRAQWQESKGCAGQGPLQAGGSSRYPFAFGMSGSYARQVAINLGQPPSDKQCRRDVMGYQAAKPFWSLNNRPGSDHDKT